MGWCEYECESGVGGILISDNCSTYFPPPGADDPEETCFCPNSTDNCEGVGATFFTECSFTLGGSPQRCTDA